MAEELRTKLCFWDVPGRMETIRLKPQGKAYEVQTDEEGRLYVIDDDGERTYLVFG